jgi:hypothetical protein
MAARLPGCAGIATPRRSFTGASGRQYDTQWLSDINASTAELELPIPYSRSLLTSSKSIFQWPIRALYCRNQFAIPSLRPPLPLFTS